MPSPVPPSPPSPPTPSLHLAAQSDIPVIFPNILRIFRHDPSAFTQGLLYTDGILWESTGLWGESSLRKSVLRSGRILEKLELSRTYFGEGMTIFEDLIYMLTWVSGDAFVINFDMELEEVWTLRTDNGQGWGITHNGTHLIISDGSETLYFMDPHTKQIVGRVSVTQAISGDLYPISSLNELEFVNGYVLANVFLDTRIAVIDPVSGNVEAWFDCAQIVEWAVAHSWQVLNGIAFDSQRQRLLITGKFWSHVFEVEVPPLLQGLS